MAKDTVVTAKVPANKEKGTAEQVASITVQWPEDITEAVAMLGEEAILTNAFANWRVTLQGNIRSGLKKGETGKSIASRLAGAKMGIASSGGTVDPIQAFVAMFQNSTPDRQKELLNDLEKDASK